MIPRFIVILALAGRLFRRTLGAYRRSDPILPLSPGGLYWNCVARAGEVIARWERRQL